MFSSLFIHRPVATSLLGIAIVLAGVIAFLQLPVAPMPQVDFPTISVQANLPGANPETVAATVAAPLERTLGRIAGVTEITSSSNQGSTRITLQFDLDRDINGALRDVQAAINAARNQLPELPSPPSFRKVNPADAPIMALGLTSKVLNRGQLYDLASTIVAQRIAQMPGVGQVEVGGSSLPAVRVQLNPGALAQYGIGLEDVRAAINAANVNRPKGALADPQRHWQIEVNDQARMAGDYLPLIVAYRNGAAVRIADLGGAVNSVEDVRNAGFSNGQAGVVLRVYKQPNANIVATVDRIQQLMPELQASLPAAADLEVVMERTRTIRSSLREVEHTLAISIGLVMLVVFLFLRNLRAALIPSVAIPVSLIGSFTVMYVCGYSLDNLSLMALTVATGFVVDDAIVVLENISRQMEKGLTPLQAAIKGAREVSFTVVSMSLSLIAVFIPILLMGGIVGRMFREFAVTLSAAVLVSLVVSLTLTPMLCARWLKPHAESEPGRFFRALDTGYQRLLDGYSVSLNFALGHGRLMLVLLAMIMGLNVYLYVIVPKGFFPVQDTGRLMGNIQADQSMAFPVLQEKLSQIIQIVMKDPDVQNAIGSVGLNNANMFIVLKPLSERKASSDQVLARLRGKLGKLPGATLYLQQAQDVRVGGRGSAAMYQYTLQSGDLDELRAWTPRIAEALAKRPELADVNSDQKDKGQQINLIVDRAAAARLGVSQALINATLNDAFGQRQVSIIYNPLNQYRVIMELEPRYQQNPEILQQLYVSAPPSPQFPASRQIPLSTFARFEAGPAPITVNHQGESAAATISFNLKPGVSLSGATRIIDETIATLGAPATLHGGFQGTAKVFQESLANQPWLILIALLSIYVVLGMLYESYIHPLTILSTLPSAGVGAILALLVCKTDFSLIALIGVILLIGIVKKNAIMMIDFALEAERLHGMEPRAAIHAACQMRFRPILMTTLAALMGALPLALGAGDGAELRQPLGISIVGGLLVSQVLTLYTTPVVYLYLDRFRWQCLRRFQFSSQHT